jgi:hypothetical protein
MKRLAILAGLSFSLLFSSLCLGDWTRVARAANGSIIYVDLEKTRRSDEMVYFWMLSSHSKPDHQGDASVIVNIMVDCAGLRFKTFSHFFHYPERMGKGTPTIIRNNPSDSEWKQPVRNSTDEEMLTTVCNHVNNT